MCAQLQGRHATPAELAASALLAVQLDQQYNGEPVQVRVPMGKEPLHLMAIFKGKMIIYEVSGIKQNLLYTSHTYRIFRNVGDGDGGYYRCCRAEEGAILKM